MPFGNVLLDAAAEGLQQGIDPVDLGLELETEADATARLLPLQIDAGTVMACAPGAGRLRPVAFDLACFAELASADTGRLA